MQKEKWLVTGGAGFIGSNFILAARKNKWAEIVNFDCLTYAADLKNLASLKEDPGYKFYHGNITYGAAFRMCLKETKPTAVIHFAAESHVDRSITNPEVFYTTNVMGTQTILQQCLENCDLENFKFLHISTDEVYGSLGPDDPAFTETTPYRPNSPYASSKAASDHMVRAYHETYGLPVLGVNCSNNYGPHQNIEKLIPKIITQALANKKIPVYGDGLQIRDWLHVEDCCLGIHKVLTEGRLGEFYNLGGGNERTNLSVVNLICDILGERDLIEHVTDRPGHDVRYAINYDKIKNELGWEPKMEFDTGLKKTIVWYSDQPSNNSATWVFLG